MRPTIVQQRLINIMASRPGAEITRRVGQNRFELLGSYIQNGRTVHQLALHRWIERKPTGTPLLSDRYALAPRGRDLAFIEPPPIADIARQVVDAYEDRFASTTGQGNYTGPIDEPMLELRAAVYPQQRPATAPSWLKPPPPIPDPQPSREALLEALSACQRLFREALPKFNWGASFLDANAITLLNEVPVAVSKALREAGLTP